MQGSSHAGCYHGNQEEPRKKNDCNAVMKQCSVPCTHPEAVAVPVAVLCTTGVNACFAVTLSLTLCQPLPHGAHLQAHGQTLALLCVVASLPDNVALHPCTCYTCCSGGCPCCIGCTGLFSPVTVTLQASCCSGACPCCIGLSPAVIVTLAALAS